MTENRELYPLASWGYQYLPPILVEKYREVVSWRCFSKLREVNIEYKNLFRDKGGWMATMDSHRIAYQFYSHSNTEIARETGIVSLSSRGEVKLEGTVKHWNSANKKL